MDKLEPMEPEFEELEQVQIDPDDTDHVVFVGSMLGGDMRKTLEFLAKNSDVFAWSHADMTGADPEVITHQLNVDPDHPPVRQKIKKFAHERNEIILARQWSDKRGPVSRMADKFRSRAKKEREVEDMY